MVQISDIPMETRWRIASRMFTGMPFLALRLSRQDSTQDASYLFQEMARDLRRIAEEHQFACDDARDLVQTLGTLSIILFGPEFDTPFIEGEPAETTIRFTRCPMLRYARERGFNAGTAYRLCGKYVEAVVPALNPSFRIVRNDAVCKGQSFCEMVIQKR